MSFRKPWEKDDMGLVAGLDEAGRGPVLGPMVLCGVMMDSEVIEELRAKGVKDSKKIGPRRREELADFISRRIVRCEIIELAPAEIDRLRGKGINLTEIEARRFSHIINSLNPSKAYVDSASVNSRKFLDTIRRYLNVETELVVECRADENYLPVSSASIVAKVRRDLRVKELKRRYGELGSGYPADRYTIKFLECWMRERGGVPEFARKSWATIRRIERKLEKIDEDPRCGPVH